MINPKEAQVTLCGTDGGAEMFGAAYADQGYVVFNNIKHNTQVQTQPSQGSGVFGFENTTHLEQRDAEATQWIDAIINDTEPLVKPEQAFVVTQILEAIYKSAETGEVVHLS